MLAHREVEEQGVPCPDDGSQRAENRRHRVHERGRRTAAFDMRGVLEMPVLLASPFRWAALRKPFTFEDLGAALGGFRD